MPLILDCCPDFMIVAICYAYQQHQHQQYKKRKLGKKKKQHITNEIMLNRSSPNYVSYFLQLTDWKWNERSKHLRFIKFRHVLNTLNFIIWQHRIPLPINFKVFNTDGYFFTLIYFIILCRFCHTSAWIHQVTKAIQKNWKKIASPGKTTMQHIPSSMPHWIRKIFL